MQTNRKIIHYNFFPSVRSQTKQNGETADSQVCETNFSSLWIYIATVARKCFLPCAHHKIAALDLQVVKNRKMGLYYILVESY